MTVNRVCFFHNGPPFKSIGQAQTYIHSHKHESTLSLHSCDLVVFLTQLILQRANEVDVIAESYLIQTHSHTAPKEKHT